MQPRIELSKHKDGFDLRDYKSKILHQYLEISTNVNESVSKYNMDALIKCRELINLYLNPIISKFAINWVICTKSGDTLSNAEYRPIVNSLKSQKGLFSSLAKTLKKSKIDNIMYKICIDSINDTKERCIRLENTILPNLIIGTKLEIYLSYLEENDIKFEDDIIDVVDLNFEDDAWDLYVDNLIKISDKYFESLSKEKQDIFIINIEAREERFKNIKDKNKLLSDKERIEKRKSAIEDINTSIPFMVYKEFEDLFNKDPNKSSRVRRAWERVDNSINKCGLSSNVENKICVVVKHPIILDGFSKSKLRFSTGSKTFNIKLTELENCSFYILPRDFNIVEGLKNSINSENYIVHILDLPILNDYLKVQLMNDFKRLTFAGSSVSAESNINLHIERFIESVNYYTSHIDILRQHIIVTWYCYDLCKDYNNQFNFDVVKFCRSWFLALKDDDKNFDKYSWISLVKSEIGKRNGVEIVSNHIATFNYLNSERNSAIVRCNYILSNLVEIAKLKNFYENNCRSSMNIFVSNLYDLIAEFKSPSEKRLNNLMNKLKEV